MLDQKDKIIFENLIHDCRIPLTTLSKLTNLTKPTLLYRIEKLEKEGLIMKYDALLNYNLLNYKPNVIFLSIPSNLCKKFESEFEKYEEVETIIRLFHKKNYVLWLVSKTKKREKEILTLLKKYTKEIDIFYFKEIRFIPYSIFDINTAYSNKRQIERKQKLDKIDLKLLEKMASGHGKDSILDLSKILEVDYHTLLYRFQKLKKNGYFLQFLAQPSPELTQNDILFLEVKNLDFNQVKEILKPLSRIPFLVGLNDNQYYLQILSLDFLDYKETIGKINRLFERNFIKLEIFNVKDALVLNRYPFSYLNRK